MAAISELQNEIAKLCRDYMEVTKSDSQSSIIIEIVEAICKAKSNGILNLVEALGPYLSNDEIARRKKGTQLLAELMHRLTPNYLGNRELELLAVFFIDRLKDHHSIQPQVIYGLLGLVSYHNLADNLIIDISQSIFAEVHVRTLVQADRRNVFNLHSNLLEKYIKPLQRMGPDFVLGFIQSIDGEKDPRNLLVCFQNAEQIIKMLQFSVFAEDLFEVTSCYFPIDFTPPQNDPYGVTKEELVTSLRKCLSATQLFAPFIMPLLMEKVSSDILSAKIDAFYTLSACVKSYNPDDVKDFVQEIWSALRNDYLLGGIKAIEHSGMETLKSVIVCLSSQFDLCNTFVNMVIKDCEQALKDPDLNIPHQLGLVLHTVAYSCPEVCHMVLPKIVEFLFSMLSEKQTTGKVASIIHIINKLLEYSKVTQEFNTKTLLQEADCMSTSFLIVTISSSEDPVLVSSAMRCVLAMMHNSMLAQNEISIFCDNIVLQLSKNVNYQILSAAFSCISAICEHKMEPSIGYFAKQFQQNILHLSNNVSPEKEDIMVKLKNTFEALLETLASNNVHSILINLFAILKKNVVVASMVLQFTVKAIEYYPTEAVNLELLVIPECINLMENESTEKLLVNSDTWSLLILVIRTMICNLPTESQESWFMQYALSLFPGGTNLVGDLITIKHAKVPLYKLLDNSKKIALLHSFVCGLRKSVKIQKASVLLKSLENAIRDEQDQTATHNGCKIYASIINKLPEGDTLDVTLREIFELTAKSVKDGTLAVRQKENISLLFLWVCRAAILRWHKQAPIISNEVVLLLQDEAVGGHVGDNFSLLINDDTDFLNEKMHANKKIMYKQRFVEFILPKLVSAFKNAEDKAKSNVSKAISHLFQYLPKKMLQKKLPPIMTLLIRSLSFSDPVILSSTLATLRSLERPDVLKEHVTSLIPRLLSLAKAPESMNLRMQAILCLKFLSNLPPYSIYPYQLNVVRSLKICLNDKKRLVRKEAYKCRNQWYLLKESN